MFGRKKDSYDEYNEKYNEKYDDDYIREEKEYRAECSHDHGQSYEDFNSEQQPYNELSELEKKFAARLESGEHILWCGKAEKNASSAEKGVGCIGSFGGIMIVFALLIFLLSPIMSIFIIQLAVIYISIETNVMKRSYAITDKRFILLNGKKFYSVPIGSILRVTCRCSERNIGYVTFTMNDIKNSGGTKISLNNGMFAIKDPERVCRILKDAIAGSRKF